MLPTGLRGWGSGLLHGPCWPIGSPAPPQGSLSTLSSAGLTSQRPPGLGVPSEATRAGTLQMAELLECPRQQNQRTRLWLRLCPSLFRVTAFCFFFFFFPSLGGCQGRKCQGLFPWRQPAAVLKRRPEGGPGDKGREPAGGREGAGGGGKELREMEPLEPLCDRELAHTRVC